MSKNKLKRFAECKTFENMFEPMVSEVFQGDFHLKGEWNAKFFKNNNPIILEIACGKGDYTIALAVKNPNINYIGVDIKGARLWRGAKTANDDKLTNVAFIRTKIEFLDSFFANHEISEIWITFPDPQKKRSYKRLSAARYLLLYGKILAENGLIHLKTDSSTMYNYTLEMIELNKLKIIENLSDIYSAGNYRSELEIKTFYEKQFLQQNKSIKYVQFQIPTDKRVDIQAIEKSSFRFLQKEENNHTNNS